MTDRYVSFDVIVYDKHGSKSATSGRADTWADAVKASEDALQHTVDNEGVDVGFATITLARRHDGDGK